MNEDQIKAYLKDKLRIKLDGNATNSDCFGHCIVIEVTILLDGEYIDSAHETIYD